MKGCLHVYCGEGKGKTTAAMGLALRMLGRGGKVVIVQFLKNRPSGEVLMLERLGVPVLRGKSGGFTARMTEAERVETTWLHNENLRAALEMESDLLVLDEAAAAYEKGLVDRALLDACIQSRPEGREMVLTGRRPPAHWLEAADYITEMKNIRHPFAQGLAAREGIEF